MKRSHSAPAVDAERVLADLRELARRTGTEAGAQRVAWTDTWREARVFLGELLDEIGASAEVDPAGNLWARLGEGPAEGALALGSHLDSVPDGGWLDGALGVMAAVGVLRAHVDTDDGRRLVLVDWADEEGARFGYSLFGSSAFAGELDAAAVGALEDADGQRLDETVVKAGVELDSISEATKLQGALGSYLELHIEQGPVLEAEGVPVAGVKGCQGIERVRFRFTGQAAHAGTTPMTMRKDAHLAAAATALRIAALPDEHGGVATSGELRLKPGISTAVAQEAALSCDLRNPDADALEAMLAEARDAAGACAAERGCEVEEEHMFRIAPTRFDEHLVALAAEASAEHGGARVPMMSGALHDAANVARVVPAAMMFCPSRAGLSHARVEDTAEEDLRVAIEAFGALAGKVLAA